MSYFARIAARASASSIREASLAVAPAMLSRSPLVEHDQRLTLPGFAERALDAGQASNPAPSPDFGSAEASPTPSPLITVARKASSASFTPSAAALGLRTEGAREPASSSTALPARTVESPALAGAEPWAISESPRSAALEPPATSPAAPSSELTLPSAPAAPAAPAATAPTRSVAIKPAELAPPAGGIFEALARADAWTRSAPRPASEPPASTAERAEKARAEPRPPLPAIAPAVYAEAPEATLGLPGGPIVSIGRLEIEVVAPARAEAVSPPRRREPPRRTSAPAVASARFAAPRAYGWRQR